MFQLKSTVVNDTLDLYHDTQSTESVKNDEVVFKIKEDSYIH